MKLPASLSHSTSHLQDVLDVMDEDDEASSNNPNPYDSSVFTFQ